MSPLVKIRAERDQMSAVERRIADFMLEDGDALYVPRGCWHDVSAVGEESLHLTLGFNPANGIDADSLHE